MFLPTAEIRARRWLLAAIMLCQSPFALASVAAETAWPHAASILRTYCLDCHSNQSAEAHVNLEALVSAPDYAVRFRNWQKVIKMVREKRMPPAEMEQPTEAERNELVSTLREQLEHVARTQAGDPGKVVLRRLTSAEYAHTIEDLTGLELDLTSILIGDAVGGEGFTNVGDVQFVQDSTLERYLEAARLVASHAVIGTGPLQFYSDPGATGLELSAIHRIQEIYRRHGFRTAAGEGGEPYGLDSYPRAMFVAWQFRHRQQLGFPNATLADLARRERISIRFAEHIWKVLHDHSASHPLSEIIRSWQQLPSPDSSPALRANPVRMQCDAIANDLRGWQRRLARSASDDEEAALLTQDSFSISPRSSFRANIDWEPGATVGSVHFMVAPAAGAKVDDVIVVWRQPKLQFRNPDQRRSEPVSLVTILSDSDQHEDDFKGHDLVSKGAADLRIEFRIPTGAKAARLTVEAELKTDLSAKCIVRCTVKDGFAEGDTAADTGEISAILGLPEGPAFEAFRTGVSDFAAALPAISHREPAPSDRDPIPPPFDGRYNSAERNEFHYAIKYHRDDNFLMEKMLEPDVGRELDQAWHDLLSSFDYHDTYLKFIARKLGRDLQGQTIADLRPAWMATLPDPSRRVVRRLVNDYVEARAALQAAEPRHVEDAIQFATAAWRRPLSDDESKTLRAFYGDMRQREQLSHVDAVRALLTRILVAPAFLYHLERARGPAEVSPLSQWELASRLSYFLWSSPPDQELRQAARRGSLADKQELARQARRMLRDPKVRRFAIEFFGQWFGFYRFDEYRGVDSQRFPEFDTRLKRSMYEESIAFFEHILRENRPVAEILFADYAFLDLALAEHYRIPVARFPVSGERTTKIDDATQFQRGGLLRLGAIQTVTSAPLRTSAVKRGDWILRRVLGTPVPPPPADAGSIPADDVLSDGKTVRERLLAHRRDESCVNCHSRMDPLGFAMENYGPVGRWRDVYRDGQPIDPAGTLNDGRRIDGFEGLQAHLRTELSSFYLTACSKLVGYALGRSELLTDRQLIQDMLADIDQGGGFSELAVRIVTSPQFSRKRGASADEGKTHADD